MRAGTTIFETASRSKLICIGACLDTRACTGRPPIGRRELGGFGLAVALRIEDKSLTQSELTQLANDAHNTICPYSHATRGNVPVTLEILGA
jgi:organic hydroperoxide reductase OsmC/OhrA